MTTNLNNQDDDSTLSRIFSTNDLMLRYNILESLFYTDTLYSKQLVSKQGFSRMQLFVSDKAFVKVYGMKYDKEFVKDIKLFLKRWDHPKNLLRIPIHIRTAMKYKHS